MVFYLIGLGLSLTSLSEEAKEIIKKAEKVYLEGYTVDFPYKIQDLEKELGQKIISLNRQETENEKFVEEAKKKEIVLLVYGAPLIATTHTSLLLKCKKEKISFKIIQNASIFDAIAETGLQLYKFGKTASLPAWKENWKPDSFIDILKENLGIGAHTLLLVDIGLNFQKAIEQLKESCLQKKIKLNKLIVCSSLGNDNQKIFYKNIEYFIKIKINRPYCIIIPGKMHFLEEEALKELSEN